MSERLPDDWIERGVKALNALGHGPQPAPPTREPGLSRRWREKQREAEDEAWFAEAAAYRQCAGELDAVRLRLKAAIEDLRDKALISIPDDWECTRFHVDATVETCEK